MVFGGSVVSALKWLSESWSARGKEKKRLALFKGVSIAHGGETIHVVWDGPLAEVTELAAPRQITPDLQGLLTDKAWRRRRAVRPGLRGRCQGRLGIRD